MFYYVGKDTINSRLQKDSIKNFCFGTIVKESIPNVLHEPGSFNPWSVQLFVSYREKIRIPWKPFNICKNIKVRTLDIEEFK